MMVTYKVFLMLVFLLLQCQGLKSHMIDDLADSLFIGYKEAVRPQCQANDTTTVDLYMSLRQIIDIDEPQQIIKLNVWIRMKWSDCRLDWYAPNFGNITGFVVPYNTVWVPDITLYDNADPVLSGLKDYRANLNQEGELKYNFPSLITSVCALDIRYFPFDFQVCSLTLGSWAYNGWEINVTHSSDKIELQSYIENSEWSLLDAFITRIEPLYDGVPFPTVKFHLKLKRKPLFYIVNVVFPCLLITFVAVLGFLLPPDSGEKISLQVTVLLSLAVFQLVILDMIPASGDSFPFISLYFTFSMLIVAFSCLLTVVVLRVHFKGKYGVHLSERIRRYFLIPLTRLTFIDLKKYSLHPTNSIDTKDYVKDQLYQERHNSVSSDEQQTEDYSLYQDKQVLGYLESILSNIKRINEFVNGSYEQHEVEKWWNVFSMAFDRLFLVIYLLCTIAVALILTAPSMHQEN
ncbi:neuronal acetylcholine receptor subunit beta-3-like [Mytilus edulis]|uniref:neuronal acetylcholine receptor subunit beta-3-like n=1 Tax=Mytilus edulis TaxID=6550 RepID=UPI0039EE5AD7